jgi:hypothetical protein
MLIQKGYEPNDIVCFKLVNGDETVAKLVEETAESYILSKPCTVIPSQQGLMLMQSLMSGDINTNITLKKSYVIMHSPVISQVQSHYIRTTTGIETAPKSGIIT